MLRRCAAIFLRELIRLWRDGDLRKILIIGPLIGLIVFYGTYSRQVIKNIPTAVLDLDRSQESREIVDYITKTEELRITDIPKNTDEMENLIKRGKVIVGVVIPENFGTNIGVGRQSKVLVVVDGSNIIYANNASSALLGITRLVGAQIGIKQLLAKDVNYSQAQQAYLAVSFRDEPWFNPSLNYAFFLVMALSLNIWQQCCTIAASSGISGEKTRASWYQIRGVGVSLPGYFSCKAVARIILFSLLMVPLYLLGFGMLKQVPACGLPALLLFTVVFAVAIDGLGSLVSAIAFNSLDATRFGMVVALPSFVIGGYTWPLEAMPAWLQKAAWILPQTWFFQGFNLLVFKNPGWSVMSRYFWALVVIAFLCYSVSAITVLCRN